MFADQSDVDQYVRKSTPQLVTLQRDPESDNVTSIVLLIVHVYEKFISRYIYVCSCNAMNSKQEMY